MQRPVCIGTLISLPQAQEFCNGPSAFLQETEVKAGEGPSYRDRRIKPQPVLAFRN